MHGSDQIIGDAFMQTENQPVLITV